MAYDLLQAQDILTPASDEAITAGVTKSKITALQPTQMIEFIHQLTAEFCLAGHSKSHHKGWSHLKKPHNFVTHTHNSLASEVSAVAESLTLNDSSAFAPSGRVAIETTRGGIVYVDFSANASNVLTVDTDGLQVPIALSTKRVHELYAVPSNFARVHNLWVNTIPFDEEKINGMFPPGGRYALFGDYFVFPRGMYTADVTLLYEKKPATVSELTSETDIPRIFQRWAIEMTLFRLFRIRRKRGDLKTTLELAQEALDSAIEYDKTTSSSNRIRVA